MNVLVVEDSRFLRMENERALTKAGHSVISAADGQEGLRLARGCKPDLVVLDMLLPHLSGPDVLRAIRKDPETAKIPVLVLSSLPQCNAEKLMGEGATAYYQKSHLNLDKETDKFVEVVEHVFARTSRTRVQSNRRVRGDSGTPERR
jgi:CheY-like chemotaxis protein